MNNAGTGHSGYCELNYTPIKDNQVDISKAIKIAKEFMHSREFWSELVKSKYIQHPKQFIRSTPHYSFVDNKIDVDFLKARYKALKKEPLFQDIEFSQDPKEIEKWLPLVMKGRNESSTLACTRMIHGTDVDFGNLTKEILTNLVKRKEVKVHFNHKVKSFKRRDNGQWSIRVENLVNDETK